MTAAGTLTFLFADLRDYTAFIEEHGDDAAAELIADYRRLVRAVVSGAGGGEIKTEGDSFYVVFASAGQALRAGLAILDRADASSARRPDRPLRIGIGVHAGEPVPHEGQYVGSAVNIAARLAQQAGAGELLVSGVVRGLLRTSAGPAMEQREGPALKGVKDPPDVYVVSRPGPARRARTDPAAVASEVAIPAAPPQDRRILCPELVGREAELARLEAQLQGALGGGGGTVLVSGEAGLGKTALLRTLSNSAAAAGARVLRGECTEIEARRPFGPFVDIAVSIASEGRAQAEDLAALLGLPRDRGSTAMNEALGEIERHRAHAAFARLLAAQAVETPALVTIEDLHWADEATLELFVHLARRLRVQRVLLVGTYRSDELHRLHPLNHLLGELARGRLAEEVRLGRLSLEETGWVIRAALGLEQPASGEFRGALHERCGGNPFFIEEVLRGLVDGGDLAYRDGAWRRTKDVVALAIPLSIRESVQQRLRPLTAQAQRALQIAAVIGQRFDFELLQQVSGLTDMELLQALRAAIDAQLIVEEAGAGGEEQYVFRHALTRESVLAELLLRERRLLHQAVGKTIETRTASRPAGLAEELAYHFDQARDVERARRYHELAAAEATSLFGFGRAVQHLERAADLVPEGDPSLGDLQLRLADAANSASDVARAARASEAALRIFKAAGDARRSGGALHRLSVARWTLGEAPAAEECATDAVDLLEPLGDSPELAATYKMLSLLAATDFRFADASAWGRKALAVAERTDTLEERADALNWIGVASSSEDPAGIELLRQSLALALEHELVGAATRAYNNLLIASRQHGMQAEDLRRLHEESVHHAHRYGMRPPILLAGMCRVAFAEGDWDECLRLTEEARSDTVWSAGCELLEAFVNTAREGPPQRALAAAPRRRLLAAGNAQGRAGTATAVEVMYLAGDFDSTLQQAEEAFAGITYGRKVWAHGAVLCAILAARSLGRQPAFDRWIELALAAGEGSRPPEQRAVAAFARAELAASRGELGTTVTEFDESLRHFSDTFPASSIPTSWIRLRRAEVLLERDGPGDRASAQAELEALVPYWRTAKAHWYLGQLEKWAADRQLVFPS